MLLMPAGFGGVGPARTPLALSHAAYGIMQEMAHIAWARDISADARGVLMEAAGYIARRPIHTLILAVDAMRTNVQLDARELREDYDTPVNVVLAPRDGLIQHDTVRKNCEKLGVPVATLDAKLAGHNAQMYLPGLVADTALELIEGETLRHAA